MELILTDEGDRLHVPVLGRPRGAGAGAEPHLGGGARRCRRRVPAAGAVGPRRRPHPRARQLVARSRYRTTHTHTTPHI